MKKTILAAAALGAATLSMAAPVMAEGDYKSSNGYRLRRHHRPVFQPDHL